MHLAYGVLKTPKKKQFFLRPLEISGAQNHPQGAL